MEKPQRRVSIDVSIGFGKSGKNPVQMNIDANDSRGSRASDALRGAFGEFTLFKGGIGTKSKIGKVISESRDSDMPSKRAEVIQQEALAEEVQPLELELEQPVMAPLQMEGE